MSDPFDEALQQMLQQQQKQDRERIEQDLRDVIEHAQKLGLPREECQLLKWGCGV